jgi:hypothetical protein
LAESHFYPEWSAEMQVNQKVTTENIAIEINLYAERMGLIIPILLGIGHSSWVPAQRPGMGVMSSCYREIRNGLRPGDRDFNGAF